MNYKETKVKETRIYDGRILNLRKDEIILPNGVPSTREVIEHNGGSSVLVVEDGKILLVKQFRYAFNEELLEIPAGKLNKGEKPKDTAIRELEEEAGLKAESVELLYATYPTPGYDTEITYIYKANNLIKTSQRLDADEFLSASWYDLKEVEKMIRNGEIKDAKTIIAVQYAIINSK